MKPSTFLKTLWGETPEGQILIWTLQNKASTWIRDPEDADDFIDKLDVYTGMAKASDDVTLGPFKRVTPSQAFAIPGLWCDFDFGDSGHERRALPPDEVGMVELIATLEPEPTLVVSSGHGRHCYWLFDEPAKLLDPDTRLATAELVEQWQRHIKDVAQKFGWWVDSTYDLARVLRLPSTFNAKNPDSKIPVAVIKNDGPRYSREWWTKHISDLKRDTYVAESMAQVVPLDDKNDNLVLDPNVALGDWWTVMIETMPDLRGSFEHRRPLPSGETSMSAYDLSLASHAAAAGRSDQDIADIIIVHRRLRGNADDLEKGLRFDYVRRTIDEAREGRTGELVTRDEIEDKELDDVLTSLGVKINRIVKLVDSEGDMGRFRLETADGNIDVGGVEVLTSETKWRNAIADATLNLPRRVPRGSWDALAQRLLDAVVVLRPGDDGHPKTQDEVLETIEWVRDYLDRDGITEINGDVVLVNGEPTDEDADTLIIRRIPFLMDGSIHFFFDDFVKWTDANRGAKMRNDQMRSRLADCGFERVRIRMAGKSTRLWAINRSEWLEISD